MGMVSKEALLARRCPEGEVEILGVGTVRVRGLTRDEVRQIGTAAGDGQDMEAQGIAWAMVEPALTVDEARAWLSSAGFGEVQAVQERINELSGIAGLAQKEAYKSVRD